MTSVQITLLTDILLDYIVQCCSGITRGRVLNGELYAQRLQKLIYLHSSSDCFMKISLQSSEQRFVTTIGEKSS